MKGTILALAVAGALMLAGCGGGSRGASMAGGASPTPTPTFGPGPIPLPPGHTLQTGTVTIPADESLPVREADGMETVIRCSAGSENCRITVAADGTVTLLAGSLRIEIQGVRVVTPTTPTTPPDDGGDQFAHPVIEPPAVEPPLVDWRELPSLIGRMNHRTHARASDFPGATCDGGVAACQAVVKEMLANAKPLTELLTEARREEWALSVGSIEGWFEEDRPGPRRYWGRWLSNSIFILEETPRPSGESSPSDFYSLNTYARMISMGIMDTTPVVGVYRGKTMMYQGSVGQFELTYTRGATGGQLNLEIDFPTPGYPVTWSNIPVDNEGAFDNGIRQITPVDGPGRVEGRFYQGGEVGGIFVNRPRSAYTAYHFGAFGGKLVPDGP